MDGIAANLNIPDTESAPVSREQVRRALAPFMAPDSRIAVFHVVVDFALYALAIGGVLFLHPWWAKLLCSLAAGAKIANLGTLAHDAAHGNLTASRRWNHLLGALCFLPGLYNYRLWLYDHHHVHHPFTNGNHEDSWVPFSKADFDRLPRRRQMLERLYRSSWGMGFAPYYIIERWSRVKFMPGNFLPARFRASAWRHFALLCAYIVGFNALLAAAPLYSDTGSVTAILLGFVVPFYVWMVFFSFTVYVQHTHARIPWFAGAVDRREAMPQEVLSLHLEFPHWFKQLLHNVYDHGAHHVNVRIPFHRLPEAQRTLNALAGNAAVVQNFSFRWLHETLRDCKLYDYETHRWLDFEGNPTGPIAVSPAQHEAIRRHAPGTQFIAQP
jgi:omega-6 fatty acid desaturase (delta-12 desaturase)